MFLKPFFDLLALGRKHDTLPLHGTCSLAVFRHDVRVLIENFDDASRSRTLETVAAKRRLVVLGGIWLFLNLALRTGYLRSF